MVAGIDDVKIPSGIDRDAPRSTQSRGTRGTRKVVASSRAEVASLSEDQIRTLPDAWKAAAVREGRGVLEDPVAVGIGDIEIAGRVHRDSYRCGEAAGADRRISGQKVGLPDYEIGGSSAATRPSNF